MKRIEVLLLPVFQNIIREKFSEEAQRFFDDEPQPIENFKIYYISKPELDLEIKNVKERNAINLPHSWEDIYSIDGELYVHVDRNSALEEMVVVCFYLLKRAEEVRELIKEKYMDFVRSSINIGFDPIPILNKKISGVKIEWRNFETIEIVATHTNERMKIL